MPGSSSGGFPALVRPMLVTPARELPAAGERWAAEFKWDGRAVAYVSGGALMLRSRLGGTSPRRIPTWPAWPAGRGVIG